MNSDRQALVLGVVPARATLESAVPRELVEAEASLARLYAEACAASGGEPVEAPVVGSVFAFPSVDAAVAFCERVQRGAIDIAWPERLLLRPECAVEDAGGQRLFAGLRIATAVDLQYRDEVGLHVLARLAAITAPGRVVLSHRAAAAWQGEQHELGAHEHPGLRGARPVFEVRIEGLPRDFGPPTHDPWPSPRWPLVGREGDLAALEELTSLGVRVVCVAGEPGIGKSRLLRRFTRDKARRGSPVVAIDLEHAVDRWDVLGALSRALGVPVRESRGDTQIIQRLAAAVLASPGVAIVVDHVTEPFAIEVLREIVRRAPGSRWLVGGPERLGVAAEVGYVVGALAERDAGARLFEDLACAADPAYQACSGSEAVAIAAELEGNPLAIELAASCVGAVRPLALFDRLTSSRGPALRVLDLVLAVRSQHELDVLHRLSVFRGPFNLDGAISVSGTTPEILRRLHQVGLLQRVQPLEAPGALFSRLHPRLRDALRERRPPEADVHLRLAEWLAARCDDWCEQLWTDRSEAVLARMSLDRETLRAVIVHMQERPRLSAAEITVLAALLEGAVRLGMWEGSVGPLLPALERALQAVGMCLDADPLVAVRLFRTRGMAREFLGEGDGALADLERAESLAERWADPMEVARSRFHIGRLRHAGSRYDLALSELRGAVDGFEEVGARLCAAEARYELARTALMTGDVATAMAEVDTAGRDAVAGGAQWLVAGIAEVRALVCRRNGEARAALGEYTSALGIWMHIGRWDEAALTRVQLALMFQALGELEPATDLFVEAETLARRWGDSPRRGVVLTQLGLVQLELGDRAAAHRSFIQAVSACRAGGDRAGQGAAKGFLGLLHHLAGRLEEARDGYRAALRDLESGGDRRYGALFHSCLGAVEAELGNLEEARILVDLAKLQLPDADPGLREAMLLFHRSLDLAHAEAAEGSGDSATAKDLRRGVDATLAELGDRRDNIYIRFARTHLASLVGGNR